jgi:hypothetical protein
MQDVEAAFKSLKQSTTIARSSDGGECIQLLFARVHAKLPSLNSYHLLNLHRCDSLPWNKY